MESSEPLGAGLPPSLADAIDRIMANPELISMVASALGKPSEPPPKVSADEAAPQEQEAPSSDSASVLTALPTLLKSAGKGMPENDRTRLLCALKPYVNPHRRDAIDTILRVSQMTELLKHLNLNSSSNQST